jgi:hypothetical protein
MTLSARAIAQGQFRTALFILASSVNVLACSADAERAQIIVIQPNVPEAGSSGARSASGGMVNGGTGGKSATLAGGVTSTSSGGAGVGGAAPSATGGTVGKGTGGSAATSKGGSSATGGRSGMGGAGAKSTGGAPAQSGTGGVTSQPPTPPTRADGFTDFQPSSDSRVYYVSAEGDDGNDGLSEDSPLKSSAAAIGKLRSGFPDWVLFRRGDKFTSIGKVTASGRSPEEPMLFGAYGNSPQRPRFTTGGFNTNGGGGAPESTDYVAFMGLEFNIEKRDPSNPDFDPTVTNTVVTWLRGSAGLLIEDCVFRWAMLTFQEADGFPIQNLVFKRSQLIDTYDATGSHEQGIYLEKVSNVTFDEVLFDHDGWHESIDGAESTIFNHNIYVQNGSYGIILKNSISMRASSHGLQFRGGGTVENNFFYRNPINVLIGGGTNPDEGGVVGTVRDNVIIESVDMDTGEARGHGIGLENIKSAVVENNLLAHCLGTGCNSMNANVANVEYTDNVIYKWKGQAGEGAASQFANPDATLADYAETLGMNLDQFYEALRQQSQFNWRRELTADAINAYFREQFSM